MKVERWLPALSWAATYRWSYLPHDVAAGATLGALLIPVGLAYGTLAGLPMAGLYGSILPLVAYALFGSSRQIVVGPDSAMAAIVAAAVAPLALGDPVRLAVLCALLGVMVGVLCLVGAVLRLGFVANFLSKPVIVGFMHGVGIVILVSQLPKVLGLKGHGETTLDQLLALLPQLGDVHGLSLGLGGGSFVTILLCRRFAPRVPGAVVALVAATLAVGLFGLEAHGVATIGEIPKGLPSLSLPTLKLADFDVLLPVALAAALLSFSDTVVAARAFAARSRSRIDADQELVGIGLANLLSGLSQGLPISASDSRTAVAEAAGSRTPLTSIVAALVVAGAMTWLTPLLRHLPIAALGGVLIAAAWSLFDLGEFRRLWRFRGISLAGALVTLGGVIALGLMEGILIGVLFSIVLLLRALAFPPETLLGRTPTGGWHDPAQRPDAAPVPGIIAYRFAAPLFFANSQLFRDRIEALVAAAGSPVRAVVVDGGAIHDVDIMACEMLADLDEDLAGRGIRLLFGNLRDRVRRDIERGLPPVPAGGEVCFASVADAVDAVAPA